MVWSPHNDPSYIGPLPEWSRESADEVICEAPGPSGVDARTVAAWQGFLLRAVPHEPLSSTEGGTGHALPHHGSPSLLDGDDSEFSLPADPGEGTQFDPWRPTTQPGWWAR